MAQPFFRVEVKGFDELDRALRALPDAVAKRVLREALKKSAAPVIDMAKAIAPRDTGVLAESVGVNTRLSRRQRRRRAKAGDVEVFIGPSMEARHAHLVEFGTVKMAARPFMRPAWDANKGRVLELFVEQMRQAIARAVRRLATRP